MKKFKYINNTLGYYNQWLNWRGRELFFIIFKFNSVPLYQDNVAFVLIPFYLFIFLLCQFSLKK